MKTNVLWTGREYFSLENCLINTTDKGSDITSTIIGYYNKHIYKVEYHIQTNAHWETVFVEINCRHRNDIQHINYQGDGKGNWTSEGKQVNEFKGCIDVDIPLTPFTNTLPINRLKLNHNDAREIQVIYIDLL